MIYLILVLIIYVILNFHLITTFYSPIFISAQSLAIFHMLMRLAFCPQQFSVLFYYSALVCNFS